MKERRHYRYVLNIEHNLLTDMDYMDNNFSEEGKEKVIKNCFYKATEKLKEKIQDEIIQDKIKRTPTRRSFVDSMSTMTKFSVEPLPNGVIVEENNGFPTGLDEKNVCVEVVLEGEKKGMDEFINGIKETLNKCKNISSVSATITGSMGEKRWEVESEATIKSVKSIKEETELIDGFDTSSLDSSIQIATTESIPGQEIEEIIDVVLGNVVGDEKVKKDPSEIERMNDLREKAINVMTEVAENLDADAIIGVDIKSSRLPGSGSGGTSSGSTVEMEILAYGTAVKLK